MSDADCKVHTWEWAKWTDGTLRWLCKTCGVPWTAKTQPDSWPPIGLPIESPKENS